MPFYGPQCSRPLVIALFYCSAAIKLMHPDLEVDSEDVLEAAVIEREIVLCVAERQRHAMRDVTCIWVSEVRHRELFEAFRNPLARISRDSFDVHRAVGFLLHSPDQRPHLRYCTTNIVGITAF